MSSINLSPDADPFDFVFSRDGEPVALMVREVADLAEMWIERGRRRFDVILRIATPFEIKRGPIKTPPRVRFLVEWVQRWPDGAERPMVKFADDDGLARYLDHHPEAAVNYRPAP